MSDIYVFGPDDESNDYSTMGLVGALTPTSCKFQEVANGDSLITMEHPKDDFGRYAALEKGNILIVPVPVRTTPEIQNGSCVTTVWSYKVRALSELASDKQRTLYKSSSGSGRMKIMQPGDILTVVQKPPSQLKINRWKAKTKYGTGWIDPDGVELVTEHIIPDNSNAIEEIQSPWTITPQIFRIYETTKNLDSISVSARHITYDLNYDICHWLVGAENSVSLDYAIHQILACGYQGETRFSVYTNVSNERVGGTYRAKTIIGAYLDAEDGVCKLYDVGMVRDNHEMYFLHDPGINRGVRLQYGKNLTGITFRSSDDEVITRIVPIGEYENGFELGIGDTVATQYIDTPNASKYPVKHVCYYKCKNAKVGQKDTNGGKVTIEIARSRMRKQAQELIDSGCDQPKIEMGVEFVNLGDTAEYADYKNLENAFLFDYVIVQHPDFDIDVTARIVEINWDCLLDHMDSVQIGSVGETIANTGVASWQIPTGFSGSKIGNGTISSGALSDGIINARHVQAESINTDALQAGCVTAIKIAANAITADKLDADTVDAKIANIVLANLTTANIQNANISWADIETLNTAIANISKAHIKDADIDWANITKLTTAVGEIAEAKIKNATISTAQIDNLAAVIASAVHLEVQTGNFTLAEIKNLLSNALILQEGVADSMMITNLAVTSANLLNATIDKLVLRGSDGKYYRVFIGADGIIQTEEVTVTDGEISAGETSDGRQIVATTANVGSLNATTVKASQAIIGTIFTESLTAGKITANEALIASMTAPLIYTTAITALGNSLDLSANESIRLTVGSSLATATVEYALSDSRTEAPTTGWSATAPEWTDGKYMWQRTTWTKRDGTKTVSDPTCIAGATGAKGDQGIQGEQGEQGVPGTNGNDGKTTYFHIKYSAVANPTSASQMTETPSTYIGTYVDFIEDDSSNPAAYTWSRFEGIQGEQGEKGIPGTNGEDGKTSYLHIAYANSADGATDFSTTDSTDKLYIGQYTDFEPLDSTDPTKYSWTRIKGEQGERGLQGLQGEQGEQGVPGTNGTDGKTTYFHIKYAPVQNPTAAQMTETPDVYIGTYVDFIEDDSTNPSDYTWARFEGAQGQQGEKGIPGTNGNDGKTYYLHIAYATSADGSTGFSTTDSSGKTYIGTCTDENPDDPTTPASYKWSLTKGEDGTGIASVTAEYYLSTSKETPTGGEWLETPPTWTTGKYMWTRTKITYKNPPSTETTEPVCDSTWEITNGLKDDIDAVSNAAETALGLAEVAQDAANGAQETANGAQESANQANERASILETQLTLTQEGLSVVRTETIPGLEGRVETIESGVHIAGSEIGIYTSDSPFRNTITNNGWVISEDGAPIITCAETKLTAPRVMVSDAFIIGGLAWKPGEDKHVRLLKYGRLS